MANTLAMQIPQNGAGAVPSGMLGMGLAQGAADSMKLHPVWQEQYLAGATDKQFPEWLKEQGIANPVIPK